MMERSGVDVEAALANANRPPELDPETAFAWQLDAAFHHLGATGFNLYQAVKIDGDTAFIRDSDGAEAEIIIY